MTGIDYIAFAITGLMILGLAKSLHLIYLDEKKSRDKINTLIIKQAEDKFWHEYEKDKT